MTNIIQIHRGRQTGRTTELIDWLIESKGRVMVVHSGSEVRRVLRLARELNPEIEDWQVITPDMRIAMHGRHVSGIAIDNLEYFLADIFYSRVDIFTTCSELLSIDTTGENNER